MYRLARSFGTTPWQVLQWSPEELAINQAALERRARDRAEELNQVKAGVQPTLAIGEW